MRLFVAVDLPENAKGYCQDLQMHISHGKFSLAKGFHITLKFLGEVDEDKSCKIVDRLKKITAQKFEATTGRIGFFPNESHARVVWIASGPESRYEALHLDVENCLRGMFPKDDFVPHITLARVKFIDDKEMFRSSLEKAELRSIAFPVDRIFLKQSNLTPDGPEYRDLAEFALQ
ncbi:MAG: 2'-5' RNA ligase [archaeon GW2011_AR3]|nr:MAG: 2'-5' RNA ligase [archaeon GW2011_AR3]MBS3109225.1 RNA 2',3'-cyclic phosphodiesterase [Candidatus Woesearchaeota archaeon]